ncbi:hypothetical protein CkP1_0238 [Citrobacter phage CkP1]|nr:hypothetical protein CkP1_0238 [Citrobacter phage CkP1]
MTIKVLLEKYRKASYAYSYGLRANDGSVRAEQELESIARDLDEAGYNLRKAIKEYNSIALYNRLISLLSNYIFAQGSYLSALLNSSKEEWLAKTLEDYNKSKSNLKDFVKELE